MKKIDKEKHELIFINTIKQLGISDITSDLGYVDKAFNDIQKKILIDKISKNEGFFIYHDSKNNSKKLFNFIDNKLIIYDMSKSSYFVLDKNLKKIFILKNKSIETKYFKFDINKKNYEDKINIDLKFKIKYFEDTVYMNVQNSENFIFSSYSIKSPLASIYSIDSGFKVNFHFLPYSLLLLDNDLNIENIKLNKALAKELKLTKEDKIHTTIKSFNEYYSDFYDLYTLEKDKIAHNSKNSVDENNFNHQYEIIKTIISNKDLFYKNQSDIINSLSNFGFIEIENNYNTSKLKAVIKKYKIEDSFVNYQQQNQRMVRQYRDLISIFFQMNEGDFNYLMSSNINLIENLIDKASFLSNIQINEKTKNKKNII